jgi:hypothetical protein
LTYFIPIITPKQLLKKNVRLISALQAEKKRVEKTSHTGRGMGDKEAQGARAALSLIQIVGGILG